MRELDKCVTYFKDNSGFARLMDGLFDLYVRYERCFGAVRLARPSPEEEETLSDFFKRDYYNQALIRIGLAEFERQMQKMFSPEIRLEALLEAYFKDRILHRVNPKNESAFAVYVESEMLPRYEGTEAETWLREVSAHVRRTYRAWADQYTADPKPVVTMLTTVCDALIDLPVKRMQNMRLSEFSRLQTGDPHALDKSSMCGLLFLRALIFIYETVTPTTPEECSALYYRAGLLTEGVLSHVVVRGLIASCGDMLDEACAAFDHRNEAHVLTLENLSRFARVEAHGKQAFIMENMTVFSAVNEQVRHHKCTLVCVSGGFNPAVMLLLDLLCASGVTLYYSGDMDYPGLCLADRFYLRYPKKFVAWRYGKSDYDRVMSEYDFYMPENKKNTGLHNEDLAALLSMMRKRGKTAPQAALTDDLVRDILGAEKR